MLLKRSADDLLINYSLNLKFISQFCLSNYWRPKEHFSLIGLSHSPKKIKRKKKKEKKYSSRVQVRVSDKK